MCQNLPMRMTSFLRAFGRFSHQQRRLLWSLIWLLGLLAGLGLLFLQSIAGSRSAFETEARIAHRLLSQRAVQHEAVLSTLNLMQTSIDPRLPAVYPQFLKIWQRQTKQPWPASLSFGNEKASGLPQLAQAELSEGLFWITIAPPPERAPDSIAYALEISLPLMLPWAEWPFGSSPEAAQRARVWLEYGSSRWLIHPGDTHGEIQRFSFRKTLAAESQPFDLVAEYSYQAADLPWWPMLLWLLFWSMALGLGRSALRQNQARKRAEELLRLGQVARLNTLGELAAGLAHELNQPLTAILATTQATLRLLQDEPPPLEQVREAMDKTVVQAQRAAAVVSRLRRVIERPDVSTRHAIDLAACARGVLQLLEPECRKRAVRTSCTIENTALALGDPVAIEQVIHNLLSNALTALEQINGRERTLCVTISEGTQAARIRLSVRDNGPGVSPELAERLFEPFVSGHPGGLGLGLSLCQTLIEEMGGQLGVQTVKPGTEFYFELPAAEKEPS